MIASVAILMALLLLNGFFSMAELAVVSAKRARLRAMAEDKVKGARQALALAEDPTSFLSIVQVGVTLISVLTGAYGGQAFAEPLAVYLAAWPIFADYAVPLAFGAMVLAVSYLNLVVGELVPKRIGLAYAETIAVHVAGIMRFFAMITAPLVWILRLSTDLFLFVMGLRGHSSNQVTQEEVKDLIAEGTQHGVIKPAEKKMLEGVMRLADRSVRTIMTPRIDMVWLGDDEALEDQIQIVKSSGYSRFPVASGDMEQVLGIVHAKDLLNALFDGHEPANMAEIMRAPLIVPDTTSVLRLVEQFRQSSQHIAIVVDEYGSVEGLVSLTDILETITGELPEEGGDLQDGPVRRDDGSWLLDGMMPIDEVETLLGIKSMRDPGDDYHTLAGFVINRMGRLPVAGDVIAWNGMRIEIVDMDARRVDKVLIHPADVMIQDES